MSEQSLKGKTTKGFFWGTVDRFASQGIQFVFGILLARLLSPDDYGIIAMLMVFLAVAQVFIDSGFSTGLVRKEEKKPEDFSTCFYFNIVVGIVAYGVLYLIAPFVSEFYDKPILTPILRIVGIKVIFSSFCIVQQAILTIKIDFKKQAQISLITAVLSGIIGLCLAYNGFGVWALVVQQVIGEALRCLLLWILANWRPITVFSIESFKYLFGFGSKMLVIFSVDAIYNNLYPIFIGKFFPARDLGLYSRGSHYAELPSQTITGILSRVTLPVLADIQNQTDRFSDIYRRFIATSGFIVFPILMGLSATASPLVFITIGPQWEKCIIYLQIICFSVMWLPIHSLNLNVLVVKGRSDLFLRVEIIKKIISVSVLLITLNYGILAMCIGRVLLSYICLYLNVYYVRKFINAGLLEQLKDLLPSFLLSTSMWGLIMIFNYFVSIPNVALLAVDIVIGATFYLGLSYILKLSELKEVKQILKRN